MKNEHELVNQVNYQLRTRVRELEGNMSSFDSVANKSSLTITSLQKELKEKQDQLLELQSRIRFAILLSFFSQIECVLSEFIWKNEKEWKDEQEI